MGKLASLAKALVGYQPALGESGWLSYLGLGSRSDQPLLWNVGDHEVPAYRQGLYIYGDVGNGKSMLMDLFFNQVQIEAKRRTHFHEFMQEVHGRLHHLRQNKKFRDADPIPRVARDISEAAWLLCFDEMQVTDIADAMILGRLFKTLFELGVVIVATSNRSPDDLYKDGLQRERFLPFIALIKERMDVLELDGEQDYRLGRKQGLKVYYTPLGSEAEAGLAECFAKLSGGAVPRPDSIMVLGRDWRIERAAPGVAWFTFDEICRTNVGPADYLALASLYHTVMVSGVPILSSAERDVAKRFVTLVDALYEHKATFICSAAAPPDQLYPEGDGAFEFRRTASRLIEMQAADYRGRIHLP